MAQEIIEANQWIFVEGGTPGYFIYKLISGKVSVYSNGAKINEVEVKEGSEPVILGIFAALRDDRMHTASVKSDSQIKVEKIYIDHIRGALRNEVPEDMRKNISTMITAIVTANEIDSLKHKLATLPKVSLTIPGNLGGEATKILQEIEELYKKFTA